MGNTDVQKKRQDGCNGPPCLFVYLVIQTAFPPEVSPDFAFFSVFRIYANGFNGYAVFHNRNQLIPIVNTFHCSRIAHGGTSGIGLAADFLFHGLGSPPVTGTA